jgi:hypothetical protein
MKPFQAFGLYFLSWHAFAEHVWANYGLQISDPKPESIDKDKAEELMDLARDVEENMVDTWKDIV